MSFAIDVLRVPHGQTLAGGEPRTRVFALTLLASVVVHVIVIWTGPALRRADVPPSRPLEVSIVRPPVPEPVTLPPRALTKRPHEVRRDLPREKPAEAPRRDVPAAPC